MRVVLRTFPLSADGSSQMLAIDYSSQRNSGGPATIGQPIVLKAEGKEVSVKTLCLDCGRGY